MKWLLRHILSDDIKLSPEQLDAVKRRVGEYASREPLAWTRNFLPWLAPLIAIPFWPYLRRMFPLGVYVAFEVVFSLVMLTVIYWLVRRTYSRHAYRAVHELGFA